MNSKSRGSSISSAKISKKLETPVATGLKNRNNKVIYVFKNGVTSQPATKFVLTSFDFNNWPETLHTIGVTLKIKHEVNFLATLNGLKVNVSDFKNGGFYVAMCNTDIFRCKPYMKIYNKEKYAEFKSSLRNSFESEPPGCSPVLFKKHTESNNVAQVLSLSVDDSKKNSDVFLDETNAKISNTNSWGRYQQTRQNAQLPVRVVKVVQSNSADETSCEENPLKRRVRSQSHAHSNIPEMRLLSNETQQLKPRKEFKSLNRHPLRSTPNSGLNKPDSHRKSSKTTNEVNSKSEQVKPSKRECNLPEIRNIRKNRVSSTKSSPIKPLQRHAPLILQANKISKNSARSSSISSNSDETVSFSKNSDKINSVDVSGYHIISFKEPIQKNSKAKELNEMLNKINVVQSKFNITSLDQFKNQKKNPEVTECERISQNSLRVSTKYLLKTSNLPSSSPKEEAQKFVTATYIGLQPALEDGLESATQEAPRQKYLKESHIGLAPSSDEPQSVSLPNKYSTNTVASKSSQGRSRIDISMPSTQKYKMKAGIRSKSAREERTITDNSINSAKANVAPNPLNVELVSDDSARILQKYATKVDTVLKPIHEEESKTNASVKPTNKYLRNLRFSNNLAQLDRTYSTEAGNCQSNQLKATNKERPQTNNSSRSAQSYALRRVETSNLTPHTDKIMRSGQQQSMQANVTSRSVLKERPHSSKQTPSSTRKESGSHIDSSKRTCQKHVMNLETRTEDPEISPQMETVQTETQKEKRHTDDQVRSIQKKESQFKSLEGSIHNEGSIRGPPSKKVGLQNRVAVCSSKTNITSRLSPKERPQTNCSKHVSIPSSTQKEGSHTENWKRSCQDHLKITDAAIRSIDKEETHTEGPEISTQKEKFQTENSILTQKEKRQTDDQIRSTQKKQSQCERSERSIHNEGSVGGAQTKKGVLQNRVAIRSNVENGPSRKCTNTVKSEYPDWIEDLPSSLAEALKQKKQNQKSTTKLQPQRRRKKFTKTTKTPSITDSASEATHPDVDISKELPKELIEENNGLGDTSKESTEPLERDSTKLCDVANTSQRVLVPINESETSGNNDLLLNNSWKYSSYKKPEKETRWSKYQQKFLDNNTDQAEVPSKTEESKKEDKGDEMLKDADENKYVQDFVFKDTNPTTKLADILRQHLDLQLNKDEKQSVKKVSNPNDLYIPPKDTNGSGDISKDEKVENCTWRKPAISRNNSNITLHSGDKYFNNDADSTVSRSTKRGSSTKLSLEAKKKNSQRTESSKTSVNDGINNKVQTDPTTSADYQLKSKVLLNVLNIGNNKNNKKKCLCRKKSSRNKTKEGAVDKVRCKKSLMRESKICELSESELLWSDKILRKGNTSYNGFDNDSNCNQVDLVFGSFYNIYELIAEQELGDAVIESELSKQIAPIFQKNEIAESDSGSDKTDLKEGENNKLVTFEERKDDVESTFIVSNNIINEEEEIIIKEKENDPMMNQIDNVEQITEVSGFEAVADDSVKDPEGATFTNDGQFEIEALHELQTIISQTFSNPVVTSNNLESFNDEFDYSVTNGSKLSEVELLARMQDTEVMTQIENNGNSDTNSLEITISSSDNESEIVDDQTIGSCSEFVIELAACKAMDALNTMENVLDIVLEEPHYLENEAKFSSMYSIKDLFIESDDRIKIPDVDLCVGLTLDSSEEDSDRSTDVSSTVNVSQNKVEYISDIIDNLQERNVTCNSETLHRTEPNLQPVQEKRRHSLKKQSIKSESSESDDYFPSFDDDLKDLRNGHLKHVSKKQVIFRKNVHSSDEEDEINNQYEENISNCLIKIYDKNDETRTKSQIFEISVGVLAPKKGSVNRLMMQSGSNLRLSIYVDEGLGGETSGVVVKELSHKEEQISKPNKKIAKFSLTNIYQTIKKADESEGSLNEHFGNPPEPFDFLDSSNTTKNGNITFTKKHGVYNTI